MRHTDYIDFKRQQVNVTNCMPRYEASAEIDRQIRHLEKSGGKIQRIKFGVVTRDSVVHLAK